MSLIGLVILLIVLGLVFAALQMAFTLFPLAPPIPTIIQIVLLLIIAIVIWQYAGGCCSSIGAGGHRLLL